MVVHSRWTSFQRGQLRGVEQPTARAGRSRFSGTVSQSLDGMSGGAIPLPPADMDRFHVSPADQVADRQARDLGVATPLTFAGQHVVQIEGLQQPEALAARAIIHPRERFIQQDQTWGMIRGGGVMRRGSCKQRDGDRQGPFTPPTPARPRAAMFPDPS